MRSDDDAAEFARRLIGGRSSLVGWNGRVRAVVPLGRPVERLRGALFIPAFRWSARTARLVRGVQLAILPSEAADYGTSLVLEAFGPILDGLIPSTATIGTPLSKRAVVVRLVDEERRAVAVCKVAVNETSDEAIERERRALSALRHTGWAPKLIGASRVDGHLAIVTEFVHGGPGSTGRSALNEALGCMPTATDDATSWMAAEHPWVTRVCAYADLPLTRIADDLPGEWPEVWSHGDFAPWNLIRSRHRGPVAIDWEEAAPDGFLGADLAHFAMATSHLIWKAAPHRSIASARRALHEHLGFDARASSAVVRLAAAAAAWREAKNGADPSRARFWKEVVANTAQE